MTALQHEYFGSQLGLGRRKTLLTFEDALCLYTTIYKGNVPINVFLEQGDGHTQRFCQHFQF